MRGSRRLLNHMAHSAVLRMPEMAADSRSQFARCSSSCFRPSS